MNSFCWYGVMMNRVCVKSNLDAFENLIKSNVDEGKQEVVKQVKVGRVLIKSTKSWSDMQKAFPDDIVSVAHYKNREDGLEK